FNLLSMSWDVFVRSSEKVIASLISILCPIHIPPSFIRLIGERRKHYYSVTPIVHPALPYRRRLFLVLFNILLINTDIFSLSHNLLLHYTYNHRMIYTSY